MPATDFRRDFGAIGALSVLLVVVSAFASGLVIWWLLPGLGLPAAVAVGAVISPPDAVAATSIGKRLGLPSRLVTILEGEGLVNDATALVMMRTALAATAGGISLWGALSDFAHAVVFALLIGTVVGLAAVWVRSKVEDPVLTTAVSFVVPFAAFIPAEELHASGVLSVVVAGLITGAMSAKRFSAHDRINERTNWRTIQLLLESGVFLLMGFQLKMLVQDVVRAGLSVWDAIIIGLIATAVLVLVRVAFVVPLVALLRRSKAKGQQQAEFLEGALRHIENSDYPEDARTERMTRHIRRRHADASFFATQGLGWRGGAVLAWSGMRGVVTLAAAQSIPASVPYRSELILIAFIVAVVTLVGQGGTLPWLIRKLGVQGDDKDETRREYIRLVGELRTAAVDMFESPTLHRPNGKPFDRKVIEHVRATSLAASVEHDPDTGWSTVPVKLQQRIELQRLLLDTEQAALLDARSSGTYRSKTIERAQHYLDLQAARIDVS
ncbi:cation:proton antiporter [Tessaracoccus sp.]|uniref:cation:proton antiporter n=1 Tax=Tessaracoccus sp. TaxID=1971211 RepID=UPI00262D091E|nr:sodium:proton antiporter [Tessaracoccus sp.]